jgi:hypothetical protein
VRLGDAGCWFGAGRDFDCFPQRGRPTSPSRSGCRTVHQMERSLGTEGGLGCMNVCPEPERERREGEEQETGGDASLALFALRRDPQADRTFNADNPICSQTRHSDLTSRVLTRHPRRYLSNCSSDSRSLLLSDGVFVAQCPVHASADVQSVRPAQGQRRNPQHARGEQGQSKPYSVSLAGAYRAVMGASDGQ